MRGLRLQGCVAVAVGLLAAGCSAMLPQPVETSAPPLPRTTALPPEIVGQAQGETPSNPYRSGGGEHVAPTRYINVTPFTQMGWSGSDARGYRFSDAYTRLVVDSSIANQDSHGNAREGEPQPEPLTYQGRSALARFFDNKHYTANLSVKVNTENFTATVPLVTIDHVSDSSGEKYNRVVYHRAEAFPLFLVKPYGGNGVVSVRVALKVSSDVQSTVAAKAIQLVETTASAVSPQSKVITTLSQQATKNLSDAVDNAVSQLFGMSLDEEQWSDRDIRYWGRKQGVTITLRIPRSEDQWQGPESGKDWSGKSPDGDSLYTIGTWTIMFDDPRPSIFSDRGFCGSGEREQADCWPRRDYISHIAPAEVLSFQLLNSGSNLGTVKSYLSQLDWFTQAVSVLSKKAGDDDVSQFCRRIKNAITDLGLNSFDAAVVTDAVRRGMPLPKGVSASMKKQAADCGDSAG